MPIRTTSDLVKGICKVKTGVDLTPFIALGSQMVDDNCVSSGYDDTKLELIERLLSSHFYCIEYNQRKFRAVSKVQESLDSAVDLGLDQTRYGQQAKLIDNKGNLAALDNALKKVIKPLGVTGLGMKWLGTDHCHPTPCPIPPTVPPV